MGYFLKRAVLGPSIMLEISRQRYGEIKKTTQILSTHANQRFNLGRQL